MCRAQLAALLLWNLCFCVPHSGVCMCVRASDEAQSEFSPNPSLDNLQRDSYCTVSVVSDSQWLANGQLVAGDVAADVGRLLWPLGLANRGQPGSWALGVVLPEQMPETTVPLQHVPLSVHQLLYVDVSPRCRFCAEPRTG